jgi:thioredoxin 1
MAVKEVKDNDQIKQVIYRHDMVIVMYTCGSTPSCRNITYFFQKFSDDPLFKQVVFLSTAAADNPVAEKIVGKTGKPFISIYKKGFLIECSEIRTEKEVLELLDKLKNETRPMFS